ncbi:MAG TPA: hypothetical protein VMP67_11965 [Candidatus Limnocylindria bacterium]|nr:hypothetical protein [Candidatus Limnocylindria bacterium]
MRVYEGAPRQNYQEVLRSIGALLDQRGMREILLTESADGFIVQGLAPIAGEGAWGEGGGRLEKETMTFVEDDIARFMEEALARRKQAAEEGQESAPVSGGFYEKALRVLGAYIDEQKPRDVFFLEQDHAFVMRLLMPTRTGAHHVLAEFTSEDIEALVSSGAQLRDNGGGDGAPQG